MDVTMFLASPHDPLQPLDRRWLRAGYLVEHDLPPSPRHDDAWVERAVAYRRALAACGDDEDRLRLAERMPAVAQAHALRLADPPLLRWAVEARILAREPFETIAWKCALSPEGVEAYERLFFNVIDKLDASSWIACQVIGPRIHHGLGEQDLDVLWRFVGYTYGPVALEAFLYGTVGLPRPASADEAAAVLARDAEALFARRKLVATHLLPVTPETAAQVLQLAALLGVIGRGGASGDADRRRDRGVLGADLDHLLGASPPASVRALPAPPTPVGAAPARELPPLAGAAHALPAPTTPVGAAPPAAGREVA
jgi:hypothetical protein